VAGREEPVWVGLDLGTQGARALAVSAGGQVVGRGSESFTCSRDDAAPGQDPREWWTALARACRAALSEVPPERVCGVATDSTSGTVLLVDPDGEPLARALMYDDSRAAAQAHRVNEAGEQVWSRLGYRMQAGWGLPKLVWLVEHTPDLPANARLAHQADYITRRLVGHEVPADSSHSLKTGYDLLEGCWPHDVLEELGVPAAMMPAVVRSGSRLGEVCDQASRETGLPVGATVLAGMTDSCAAQLAAGALGDGSWNSVLGTTLALKGASSQLVRDPNGTLYCHIAPDGGWLPGGASSTGAGILSATFPGRDLDDLGGQAAEHEDTGVLAYPLASPGERFPFDAPQAEGFMLGRPEGDGERFAALLQGLAFVERLCFDYVDLLGAPVGEELTLTGGSARGGYFSQLRSDVLGRPVRLVEHGESAFGMAVLAASEDVKVAEAAAAMVRVAEVIEPRSIRAGHFLPSYARLVGELEERGWLPTRVADHARARARAAA
jgi:D-ribulokinase